VGVDAARLWREVSARGGISLGEPFRGRRGVLESQETRGVKPRGTYERSVVTMFV